MRFRFALIVSLVLAASCFAGSALAAPDLFGDPGGFAKEALALFQVKAWAPLIGLLVLGLVSLIRIKDEWITKRVPFFGTQTGRWALNGGLSLVFALALGLYLRQTWRQVAVSVVQAAYAYIMVAGIYQRIKDWLAARARGLVGDSPKA